MCVSSFKSKTPYISDEPGSGHFVVAGKSSSFIEVKSPDGRRPSKQAQMPELQRSKTMSMKMLNSRNKLSGNITL